MSTFQLMGGFVYFYSELNFKKGDIIYIRRVLDENWLEGEHNGKTGILPVNYLEVSN